MAIRIALLAAVFYFTPKTFATNYKIAPPEGAATESEEWSEGDEPEPIVKHASLAAFMGMTPQNVIFGQPRNFRTEGLNNIQLEPLYETDGE